MNRYRTLVDSLRKLISGPVLLDEPMDCHTSMGVGGPADMFIEPADLDELSAVLRLLAQAGTPLVPLGNGSNVIVRDGGIRGAVVSTRGLTGLELKGGNERTAISAEPGVPLHRLVEFALASSLEGLEFCAGIPGTVGGAVRMNAGAYGREMKDVVAALLVADGVGRLSMMDSSDLRFGYRKLFIDEGLIIAQALFRVAPGDRASSSEQVRSICALRRQRHPLEYRSAGSVFKNPPGRPAGRIIDELGLKGLQIGGAKVSELHGNFIVNLGGARASDVISLIEEVHRRVHAASGIDLDPEVKIIGSDQRDDRDEGSERADENR
ncbi:MAG: UDP-N-acetylmuramate dehydrogenase [Deltaproteobacteria bacterium]|nr:UDP-N-acetylmuramate dehydrogenase [Deltaproteobacteria bacterium]